MVTLARLTPSQQTWYPSSAVQRIIPYTKRRHGHEHISISPLFPFSVFISWSSFTSREQLFSGHLRIDRI